VSANPPVSRTSGTLSEVLRAVRLTGAVFFAVDASAPWVADTPAAREIGPQLMPGLEHVIEYHAIAEGKCWAGRFDETPILLEAGDVICFPQGDAHVISSAPGMRGEVVDDILGATRVARLPVRIQRGGGGAERTRFICGFLGFDRGPFNPLLESLPRTIHMPQATRDGVIDELLKLALRESAAPRPGGETILSKLSELLFVELVRQYTASLPPEHGGWLAGLRDESVGRALAKIHERPSHDFSLEELAHAAGVSRSVLAERFADFVGVPPMQYLARWRMQLAATLLSTTQLGVAEVAERVGYSSETALGRSFKRWVGVSPAGFRRGERSAPGYEPVGSAEG